MKSKKSKILLLTFLLCLVFSLTACAGITIEDGNINIEESVSKDNKNENTPALSDELLEVHFIDVGQADAVLIKKGNEAMVVDAGKNETGEMVVKYIKDQGVTKLKYVIGTHPHEDHIGGLDNVIDAFQVEKVIMPNATNNTKTFEDVLDSISKKKLKITKPVVGDKYLLSDAEFTILAPNSDKYGSLNDYSVSIVLKNGENRFLFTGDAEALSENEMLNKNKELLKADVFKVAHHGSSTSNTSKFLDAINPKIGVIMVGADNSYGHPHKEIVTRLDKRTMDIYRTDLHGHVIVTSDGKNLETNQESASLENGGEKPEESNSSNRKKVTITKLDKKGELVTIKNESNETIDLQGWKLVSERGNQEFIFPSYSLKSNASITISSGENTGDLHWGKQNIWSNAESDPAILFDADGNPVSNFDD